MSWSLADFPMSLAPIVHAYTQLAPTLGVQKEISLFENRSPAAGYLNAGLLSCP